MQRYLKDILANPPHSLGHIANFLLIVSAVLLASIFFVQNDKKEITLNVLYDKAIEKEVDGAQQTALLDYQQIYPLVSVGQEVQKGDTLFTVLSPQSRLLLKDWLTQLKAHKLVPTKEMLELPMVSKEVKVKMIALAKAQHARKESNSKSSPNKNKNRIVKLEGIVAEFEKEVEELTVSIPQLKSITKNMGITFEAKRSSYEANEITLEQLTKAKGKLDESENNILIRNNQLQTAKHQLWAYKSEYDALVKEAKKRRPAKKDKGDVVALELDLSHALESLEHQCCILSEHNGKIESLGHLEKVSKNDLLVRYHKSKVQLNRGKTFFVKANAHDAKNIYEGSSLLIYLPDGSNVEAEIIGMARGNTSEDHEYEIASTEVLTIDDITKIVLPSKDDDFIEKVMENF